MTIKDLGTLTVPLRLDLDTEKPSEEELAKKFGYEEAYYKGFSIIILFLYLCITPNTHYCQFSLSSSMKQENQDCGE